MTRIAYVAKKFGPEALRLIKTADDIMTEYEAQGFALTLRQLYYQFVARGVIVNTIQSYKRLGGIVNDARLAGLLDWDNIEDRTRNLSGVPTWQDPGHRIRSAANSHALDLWEGQPTRPEVWIEKEALSGVVEPTCAENRVDFFACRGYTSQSEQWRAACRIIRRYQNDGQKTAIFHLGDHDPSGIDMTRDNLDRLRLFIEHHLGHSRANGYIERFGMESWELDALDPTTIATLLETNISRVLDDGDRAEYDARQALEAEQQEQLRNAAERWDEVADFLKDTE